MKNPLRVHICPVGFEVLRIVEPLIRMRADKAYLLSYHDEMGLSYATKVKHALKRKDKSIEIVENSIELWDLFKCIACFKQIIQQEKGNLVYINVSTGTKVTAIAGTIVSMLMDTIPYYARVDYDQRPPRDMHTIGDAFVIPVYRILSPKNDAVHILELLSQSREPMSKKDLIEKLQRVEVIKSASGSTLSPSAAHNQLRTLLAPLEKEWKFVNVMSRGRASLVELTEDGKRALEVFR
jgi:uncharacterized protein DUF6293